MILAVMECSEYKRLVALHLQAIAVWKKTFDDPEAWAKAIAAESAIEEHCRTHRCLAMQGYKEGLQR